ncbi:GSCFA domain-containing protein [Rhizosphaericola mali]|uniref:GSCFA domain-containing protein n=1 Tax=Rhizosphaericola mali TaxID=2545455 RepID=A0A5P2G1M2_9BACT|nr:GSCFA domain-containing protein [Rhizosphaericola mali]QES87740.1 GSCFA domain-containing protein [Rhizosphaericola mali]
MQFQIPINIPKVQPTITYEDKLMLLGSCFTEHIGSFLENDKFNVFQNPFGIIFDPLTISNNVIRLIENRKVEKSELFERTEIWHHWDFHSAYSALEPNIALEKMNNSIENGYQFLKETKWLIITLGTAYNYTFLSENRSVANCHKVPGNQFRKNMMTIEEIIRAFDIMLYRLFHFNKDVQVIFTISPVRHIKDGIVENNRSKARLLEAAHHLVDKFDRIHYFPAYEILIDVLRDYRFYDADLVHPNYAGTAYVLDLFKNYSMSEETIKFSEIMHKIYLAKKHKPFNPESESHQKFLQKNYELCQELAEKYPYLNFEKELAFFKIN